MVKNSRVVVFGALFLLASHLWSQEINYDTAWTYIYNGGFTYDGWAIEDNLKDVKVTPDGKTICVGSTRDTNYVGQILLLIFNRDGSLNTKKTYRRTQGVGVTIARNGDLLIGGAYLGPHFLRTYPDGTPKWNFTYYDTVKFKDILAQTAYTNEIVETADGRIIGAVGDPFPDNNNRPLNNYAGIIELDSNGTFKRAREWVNVPSQRLGAFSIVADHLNNFFIGGNEAVSWLDSKVIPLTHNAFNFNLPGVGTEQAQVRRLGRLRNNRIIAVGQAYEEDCWKKYQRLYYDGWWATLTAGGSASNWHTHGYSGKNDIIWDFDQLVNGNLIFIGRSGLGEGIWAFVTDSTGSKVLWDQQLLIPSPTERNGRNAYPYAVAASPDSGFTVVGLYPQAPELGGENAFVAHFKPAPVTAVGRGGLGRGLSIHHTKQGGNLLFRLQDKSGQVPSVPAVPVMSSQVQTGMSFEVYNMHGKVVYRQRDLSKAQLSSGIQVPMQNQTSGLYLYRLHGGEDDVKGVEGRGAVLWF